MTRVEKLEQQIEQGKAKGEDVSALEDELRQAREQEQRKAEGQDTKRPGAQNQGQ